MTYIFKYVIIVMLLYEKLFLIIIEIYLKYNITISSGIFENTNIETTTISSLCDRLQDFPQKRL